MNKHCLPPPQITSRPIGPLTSSILAVASILFLILSPPVQAAAEPKIDWFFETLVENPDETERVLRQSNSEPAKLYLALLLHLERPKTEERNAEIVSLLSHHHYIDKPLSHEETLRKIIESIRSSVFSRRRSLRFPCSLLKKHVSLYPIIGKMIAGRSSRVGHDCSDEDFLKLESVRRFWSLVDPVTWHARQNCREGTITRDYAAGLKDAKYLVYMAPSLIRGRIHRIEEHGLRSWAVFSRWNWDQYEPMEKQFKTARRDLAAYYRDVLGIPEPETIELAGRALLARIFGVRNPTPWQSLHADILSGASLESIREKVGSGSPTGMFGGAEYSQFAGSQEPAMMLAVTRPDVVSLLLQHGGDPNVANDFGKTPLMAAAQYDDLQSLNALITAGAKINARSSHPSKIHDNDIFKRESRRCNAYNIKYGERTALMYAAANASRPVIEALLKAGADPTMADSEGNTADDYLTGRGPTGANPKLTNEERYAVTDLLKSFVTEKQKAAVQRRDLNRKLLVGAADGSIPTLRQLIDQGADLKTVDSKGKSALHFAVESGDADTVAYLLSKGADPNERQGEAQSTLELAIIADHTIIAERLIAGGAEVNKIHKSRYGTSIELIELAQNLRRMRIVHLMIDAGASKTLDDKTIRRVLMRIIQSNDHPLLDRLVGAGVVLRDKPELLRMAVEQTPATGVPKNRIRLIQKLIAAGIDVNATVEKRTERRALHFARNPAVITALVSAGANTAIRDIYGRTPLIAARGNIPVMRALTAAGAKINVVGGEYGRSPLHTAVGKRPTQISTIKFLLDAGVPVDVRDSSERTPLMFAHQPNVIRFLLDHGADLKARTKAGDTVLHRGGVYRNVNTERLEILLRMGADPNATNYRGITPLSIAARHGDPIHLDTLLRSGAELEQKDKGYQAALHYAAKASRIGAVRLLLRRGADPNTVNQYGSNPLLFAVILRSSIGINIIRTLLAYGTVIKENTKNSNSLLRILEKRKGSGDKIKLLKAAMSGEPVFDKPFHCKSEGGFLERAICSDSTVEATHRRMSELYDKRRRALRGEALRAAIDEHRTWLRRRTAECRQPKFNPDTIVADITPCLLTVTTARLRELENKPAK